MKGFMIKLSYPNGSSPSPLGVRCDSAEQANKLARESYWWVDNCKIDLKEYPADDLKKLYKIDEDYVVKPLS